MPRKRRFSTFSLSFLDIMSCGFGAVALIFLIIKHDVDNTIEQENQDLSAEVNLLQEEIRDGESGLVRARNTLSELDQRLADANGLARRIERDIAAVQQRRQELLESQNPESLAQLRQRLEQLQQEKQQLEEQQRGNDVRQFLGQGNRQYLTGMKMGGSHILILLDRSASMLDERLVNIIRLRNMPEDAQRSATKWQRSLSTVDWLTAQFPQQSRYQIYTFNTRPEAAIADSYGQWLNVSDRAGLEQSMLNLRQLTPTDGTNLQAVFQAASQLSPRPDNIFLITDGLPTQGRGKPRGNTVSGADRQKLFDQALQALPSGVPINVILAPMEGDPMAAASFWHLAQITQGSFISPSRDWP